MDTWYKVGTAILLVMMLLVLLPRARQMLRDSPKAEGGDWTAAVLPVLLVVGFVVLLMWLV
jgi:hypothetical protein